MLTLLAFPAAALAAHQPAAGATKTHREAGPKSGGLAPMRSVVQDFERTVSAISHRIDVRRRRAALQRRRTAAREQRERFAALPGGVSMATLEAIASCESGGDPTAVSSDGTYRGKYQFDYGTWESVGGHGDPAAAPEAEQDYRAALLYARSGSSPWPVCG